MFNNEKNEFFKRNEVFFLVIPIFFFAIALILPKLLILTTPPPPYYVYKPAIDLGGGDYLYLIKNPPNDTTIEYGFACICDNQGGPKKWVGKLDSGCAPSPSDTDKVIPLSDSIIPRSLRQSKPVPVGACCQKNPRVVNTGVSGLGVCG